MSDIDGAAPGAGAGEISLADAAASLAQQRHERNEPGPERATSAADDPDTGPAAYDDADGAAPPDRETSGETDGENDPAEPIIAPPRSWSKADKEIFATLPRETQERLVEIDRAREKEIRRGQNEIAERHRALQAQAQAVEQARAQYEQAVPALLQQLQAQYAGEFGDIQTQDDVLQMAEQDPARYTRWDAHVKRIAAAQHQMVQVQQHQAHELAQRWQAYSQEQDRIVTEKIPDLADQKKAAELRDKAVGYLQEAGFAEAELGVLWNGRSGISLRDARVQAIIFDAMRYRAGQEAIRVAQPKPVPPVQRPGSAPARGEGRAVELKILESRLDQSGSLKDAAALLAARRASRRR